MVSDDGYSVLLNDQYILELSERLSSDSTKLSFGIFLESAAFSNDDWNMSDTYMCFFGVLYLVSMPLQHNLISL